jgi:hypothetical protein
MNFIAHYYFANTKSDPYYSLGLVMPDLVRIFMRGKHIFPNKIDESKLSKDALKINKGGKMHLEQDRVFHNCNFFNELMEVYKQEFKKNGVTERIPKSWFLAHVAIELILDRVLMRDNESITDDFYVQLENVSWEPIEELLRINNLENLDLFKDGFSRFVNVRYLFAYQYNDRLIYSLNRICSRAGITGEWNAEQKSAMELSLEPLINETAKRIPDLKKELSLKEL